MSRWQHVLRAIAHRIWFRAAVISLFSVATALLAAFVAPLIPYDINAKIGADAVDNILTILASSMLAVTTFSLTAMVSAFSAATSSITPRAIQLLVEDSRAQNALSTFLGAFLFSIVGICALSTGLYGPQGRVILYVATLLVIAWIVITLLRWIEHLATFGRMADTVARVEKAACHAIERTAARLCLSGAARPDPPEAAITVDGERIGFVTHVDLAALEKAGTQAGTCIYVDVLPGGFVAPGRPVARFVASGEDAEATAAAVREAFTIAANRDFANDPRFGLVVLGEIASRALSPGINDPGTAITVLGSGLRVMRRWLEDRDSADPSRRFVVLPQIALDDLIEDFVRPIARDGAGQVEVGIRLHKMLGALAAIAPSAANTLGRQAADALARADAALSHPPDRAAVHEVYARYWRVGGKAVR